MESLRATRPDAIMHVGFGHGLWGMNDALRAIGWDPPRYTTTPFELAYFNHKWMGHLAGFIGLDPYDERNEVGQEFLDRFEKRFGRRPAYFTPGYGHDVARLIAHGLADAAPLTGRGVKDALEQVKMLPAASGTPGTRLRFGKYIHSGWMGAGYLVARRVRPDGSGRVFHGSIDGTTSSTR